MDPPDATFDRDRELLDPSPVPPVRLLRPSAPYSDPEHGRSIDAIVGIHERVNLSEAPPASPGQTTLHPQEASDRRLVDDVATRQVGGPVPLQYVLLHRYCWRCWKRERAG